MFDSEFTSYPGRAEMLALIGQRSSGGALQDQRDSGEGVWPGCVFPPVPVP